MKKGRGFWGIGSLFGRFLTKTVVPMGWFGFWARAVGAAALALFRTVNYVSKANGVRRYGVRAIWPKHPTPKNFCKNPNELRSTQTPVTLFNHDDNLV